MNTQPSMIEQLEAVPLEPGCYLWKDASGEVLYVGKAKVLRARMKQYVQGTDERAKIPFMMEQVASFDYVVCSTETEALVLEKNLIQELHPPFNVDYRDDKSYPFIAITAGEPYPAIKYTRERHRADTHYFGPYTNAHAARDVIDTMRKIVPICHASCVEHKRLVRQLKAGQDPESVDSKPCFDFHVGIGPGPCCGACTPEEYAENVRRCERFLSGHRDEFVTYLRDEMEHAAADLDFERAARMRDRLAHIDALREKQKAVSSHRLDADVIGFFREETICGVQVLVVREGRIINGNEFILNKGLDVPRDDLVETFILHYYDSGVEVPAEVVIGDELEEAESLENWLTVQRASAHGAKTHIHVPRRGEKLELLKMAQTNARHSLMRYKVRTRYEDARINEALLQLESALALERPPMRIECFDVSTIHGRHSVSSMVVFTAGRKDTAQYRRFKIRLDSPEADDFAMMQETFARRYAPERMADERFGSCPDLIVVDGGLPQLHAAVSQLDGLGLDIPVVGLAKADEEVFTTWGGDVPVRLPNGSASLYLIKQIRDEAHRFAITYHRNLRGKAMTVSILDEVDGLGPKRKHALLKHFGSFKRLRAATLEEIEGVPGVPEQVAREVYETLQEFSRAHEQAGEERGK
jgi:excinuclease ABC subunit C